MKKVLIIDTDPNFRELLGRFLQRNQYEVISAETEDRLLDTISHSDIFSIIYDVEGDSEGSEERFTQLREKFPGIPVIVVTNTSDIKLAVNMFKKGARDCLIKPLLPEQVLQAMREVEQKPATSTTHIVSGDKQPQLKKSANGMLEGESQAMKDLMAQVELVAPTSYSIIINGESGSGKEATANAIHRLSERRNGPFMAIDCGTLTPELAASELFGHVKGAFTGAVQDKTGLIEMAEGGTLFLDEIANLSYDVQVSLLRAIQERKIRKVGGSDDIRVNVRIIVASNENLWVASLQGRFRQDLYHRLNEFSMQIPALRERKTDILPFARHFLEEANRELDSHTPGFTPEAEEAIYKYAWPGNLRELKNNIRRAALLAGNYPIGMVHLPRNITAPPVEEKPSPRSYFQTEPLRELKSVSEKAEMELIIKTLEKVNYNKSKAAHALNISRRTLYNKLRQLFKDVDSVPFNDPEQKDDHDMD